jgi:hypothetical protein
MTTQQILASYYKPDVEQIIMMAGVSYKHEINGEWFVVEE